MKAMQTGYLAELEELHQYVHDQAAQAARLNSVS
jgi:hypothetical protein